MSLIYPATGELVSLISPAAGEPASLIYQLPVSHLAAGEPVSLTYPAAGELDSLTYLTTTPLNRGLKNLISSVLEDFDPLEATMPLKRGLENPRPSIVEDFGLQGATTPLNRCFKNPRSSIFEDCGPPEATTVGHRGLTIQSLQSSGFLSQRGWLVCKDGPRPGLGPARMSYLGLQALPGSINPAWVYKWGSESSVGLQV